MNLILYRHAKPIVSGEEIISGGDIDLWMRRYEASEIELNQKEGSRHSVIYSSNLQRSISTARLMSEQVIQKSDFREAELPVIRFPKFRLKAKYWVAFTRLFWLLGYSKNCESNKLFKTRVDRTVSWLEQIDEETVVIVGHGWFNRVLIKALLKKKWFVQEQTEHQFFNRCVLSSRCN